MRTVPEAFRERYDALVAELLEMGEFRRGSISERRRTCGKPHCACADKKHPGHAQRILTFKDKQRTRTVNLPSAATLEMTRGHVREHDHFLDWSERWQTLQEAICNHRMKELAVRPSQEETTASRDEARKKKSPRASRRKSHGK